MSEGILSGSLRSRVSKLPIFCYWQQGFDRAPPVVRICHNRLLQLHTHMTVHLLDEHSVSDFMNDTPLERSKWERLCRAHQSDLIRTKLLLDHGGIWVDATVWCARPIDDWLGTSFNEGVFFFARPGVDRIISNWFIAAEAGNPLLRRLYDALCAYWNDNEIVDVTGRSLPARLLARALNRNLNWPRLWLTWPARRLLRAAPYMIYHFLFYDLICRDREFREIWERIPRVSAVPPHQLKRYGLNAPVAREVISMVEDQETPLFKLDWRVDPDSLSSGSLLSYLAQQSGRMN